MTAAVDGEKIHRHEATHVLFHRRIRGHWSLEPDPDVLQRNVQAAIDFFSMVKPPAPGARLTRSEAPQSAPAVNSFFDAQS